MKLKDLLFEARIFGNNFIKINMIENELSRIFVEDKPKIQFDENGLYIMLDIVQFKMIEQNPFMDKFALSEPEIKSDGENVKKFYIDVISINDEEPKEPTSEEPPAEQ